MYAYLFGFSSLADYYTAAITGAICFSLALGAALKCMHAGGYIFQSGLLPRTLVCNNSYL